MLAALARAWGGGSRTAATRRAVAPPASAAGSATAPSAMEGLAAVLGPPTQRYRPPCRMLNPAVSEES